MFKKSFKNKNNNKITTEKTQNLIRWEFTRIKIVIRMNHEILFFYFLCASVYIVKIFIHF